MTKDLDEQILDRAYELWCAAGRPALSPLPYYLTAEREFLAGAMIGSDRSSLRNFGSKTTQRPSGHDHRWSGATRQPS
jgi:Protein of unknown function (DUF2934)